MIFIKLYEVNNIILIGCVFLTNKERALAVQHGYPDPINATYEDTTAMYNSVAQLLLKQVLLIYIKDYL